MTVLKFDSVTELLRYQQLQQQFGQFDWREIWHGLHHKCIHSTTNAWNLLYRKTSNYVSKFLENTRREISIKGSFKYFCQISRYVNSAPLISSIFKKNKTPWFIHRTKTIHYTSKPQRNNNIHNLAFLQFNFF